MNRILYRWILLTFLITIGPVLVRGQASKIKDLPKVVPPSPNVAALGKYGDAPVGFYNGIPSISIPLYEIQAGDISIPISLSYHASGIKVAEESSRVGLGWALMAGGSISRSVMGQNDFATSFSYFLTHELPLGFQRQPSSWVQHGCDISLLGQANVNLIRDISNGYDFEPDQFSYNFLNYSGKFILKRNKEAVLAKQEKIRIVVDPSGNFCTVTTADGTVYLFNETETSTPYQNTGHITAWHLKTITSISGEVVTFNYTRNTSYSTKTIGGYSERKYEVNLMMATANNRPGSSRTSADFPPPANMGGPSYTAEAPSPVTHSLVYLKDITFSSGKVEFTHSSLTGTDKREDVENEVRLMAIKVSRKNADNTYTIIKEFNLGQRYFTGRADQDLVPAGFDSPYAIKRLKLESLTESATVQGVTLAKPPYRFFYNEEGNLPAKTSLARDHWGYFNGRLGNTSLIPSFKPINGGSYNLATVMGIMGPERDVDPTYNQVYSLKEMQYPTGGRTEFRYETHDYALPPTTSVPVAASKTLFYPNSKKGTVDEQVLDLSDEFRDKDGKYGYVELVAAFRFSGPCKNVLGNPNVYFEIVDAVGNRVDMYSSRCSSPSESVCLYCDNSTYSNSPVFQYRKTLLLAPGKYRWRAYAASDVVGFEDISATYSYTADKNASNARFGYGGGLRIAQIIDKDDVNEANNKVRVFEYNYEEDKNGDLIKEKYSYGKLMSQPQYSYCEYQNNSTFGALSWDINLYLVRSSDSNVLLNGSAGGSVVGYDQVTVKNGLQGEFGKTVYQYHNEPDQVLTYEANYNITPDAREEQPANYLLVPLRPPAQSTVAYEKNGLLKEQAEYAYQSPDNYNIVKKTENDYFATSNQQSVYYGVERRKIMVPSATYECNEHYYIYPALKSNWVYLRSSTETVYDMADVTKSTSSTTSFTYENETNPQHFQVKRVSRSTSDAQTRLISEFTYPADYTAVSSGILKKMKDNYLHNAVIETVEKVQRTINNVTSESVVGASYTTYGDVDGANHIFPLQLQILKLAAPKPAASFSSSVSATNPSGAAADGAYDSKHTIRYKASSRRIMEEQPARGIPTAYLWGYNNQFPVAQIVNATADRVAFTSFEYGTGEGEWAYSGQPTNGSGKTGSNHYTLSSGNITKSLLADTYRLTYWAKSGTLTVSVPGVTVKDLATSAADANGWVLYEKQFTLTATTTLTISGTAPIDELRVYPSKARMISFTYDPLGGTTSQTDATNVITYYEYDPLQRLQYVRDLNRSLNNKYIYHYKGQP